jgi:predicted porin
MKKSLVALAALAAAGVASAQSSVTLFGVVDAAVSYYQTTSKYTNTAVNVFNLGEHRVELLQPSFDRQPVGQLR